MKFLPSSKRLRHNVQEDQLGFHLPKDERNPSSRNFPANPSPQRFFTVPQRCVVICSVVYLAGINLQDAIPRHYLTHEWIQQIENRCRSRPDLCVEVQTAPHRIRWFWIGRAFYFTAVPGKTAQLKAHIVQAMPDSKWDKWLSPWNFVVASFTELSSAQ